MSRRWKIRWGLALVLALANGLVWSVAWRESRAGELRVAFLDIGQGDAIYIEAPNGNQILVDGGPGKAVLRQLAAVMPWYDRSLDLVVATHPDADHIGGLPEVLRRYRVSGLMEPGVTSPTGVYQELEQTARAQRLSPILARRGMTVVLAKNVSLDILFPDRDPTGWETNEASIVARLRYGAESFLLTGDSPQKIERYLLALDAHGLSSTVLKAGHHGSRTSSAPEYLAAVQPTYAVISAGLNNRYGHPHPEVMALLKKMKIEILQTSERGNIEFRTNGQRLEVI